MAWWLFSMNLSPRFEKQVIGVVVVYLAPGLQTMGEGLHEYEMHQCNNFVRNNAENWKFKDKMLDQLSNYIVGFVDLNDASTEFMRHHPSINLCNNTAVSFSA